MKSQFFSAAESRRTTWRDALNNIKLNWKLIILIAIMLLGSISVALVSGFGMTTLRSHLENIYSYSLLPIVELQDANSSLAEAQANLEALKNPYLKTEEVAQKIKLVVRLEKTAEAAITRYESQWISTRRPDFRTLLEESGNLRVQTQETAAVAALRESYTQYMKFRERYFATIQAGNIDSKLEEDAIQSLIATRGNLGQLIRINLDYANILNRAASDSLQGSMTSMLFTILIAAIIGTALAFILSRSITTRLEVVATSASLMQQGKFSKRAEVTGRDEIAQLASSFNTMAGQLNDTLSGLEQRVAERTNELEKRTRETETTAIQLQRRASQLQAIADVSREIAQVQEITALLPKITDVVSLQFGFYHVGIFLIDAKNEYAVLRAANSLGGKSMLANGHKLKIGETGIVGYVGKTGRPRVALSTGEDAVYFNNPYLPETRSELALPMKIGNRIIGALDVQSKEPAAFTQEDVAILTVLADQVSVAVENARLFDESRLAATEAEKAYQQYLSQERKTLQAAEEIAGYMYSEEGLTVLDHALAIPEFDETAQSGKLIANTESGSPALLSIPIKLRDDVIGVLGIRSPDHRGWDQDEIDIVQAIADRVAISIESARLLESSRRRASKEQLIGAVTSKIGASINMRAVLQTAVEELGRVIPGSEVTIQFKESLQ